MQPWREVPGSAWAAISTLGCRLLEPPPRPASDTGPHGYREAARENLAGWDESPPTRIGLELLTDVDAILAIVVILRIEARLRERARRLA